MEHSPSWEANSSLHSLEIPFILWNLKDHYHLLEITNTVHRCIKYITLLLLFILTCFSHFSMTSGRFWGLLTTREYVHTNTHSIDPSVCHMTCRYETSYNTVKTWLYKTVTSPLSETCRQKYDYKNSLLCQ